MLGCGLLPVAFVCCMSLQSHVFARLCCSVLVTGTDPIGPAVSNPCLPTPTHPTTGLPGI